MDNWKKWFFRAAGFGAGFATVGAIVLGIIAWWSNRPPKPKPWNPNAITAAFSTMSSEGEKNTLEFIFTLENHTDNDYRVSDGSQAHLGAQLHDANEISFEQGDFLKADYPIYIPAHDKVRFMLHVGYPFAEKEDLNPSDDARHDYNTKLAAFATKEFSNLSGFVLMDENARYKIVMPSGWIERGKEPLRVKLPSSAQ